MSILGLDHDRFNRSTFFFSTSLSIFLLMAVSFAIFIPVAAITNLLYPMDSFDPIAPFIVLPLGLFWYFYLVTCVVKRLHDLGVHGAWAVGVVVGSFVPFVNIGIAIWLLFIEGSEGANQYGEPLDRTYILGLAIGKPANS